jgi:hypothetical protein
VVFQGKDASTEPGEPSAPRDDYEAVQPSDDLLLYDPLPAGKLIDKHRALRYPYTCKFGSATLEIIEGVFCPTFANAPRLLLETVRFKAGQHVLDVFSGSGAFGIIAALAGASVVTVDISARAVR